MSGREHNFGLISGVTLLLRNIGSIASAEPLAMLLKNYSWRSVFLILGGLTIGLGLLTALFVRNRPEDPGFPSLREMEGKASHPGRKQHIFGWAMDRGWNGRTVNGLRVYSSGDYHAGFLCMLVFAAIGILGATRIRETNCRNITITN